MRSASGCHAAHIPSEALHRAGSLPRSCQGAARRLHLPGAGAEFPAGAAGALIAISSMPCVMSRPCSCWTTSRPNLKPQANRGLPPNDLLTDSNRLPRGDAPRHAARTDDLQRLAARRRSAPAWNAASAPLMVSLAQPATGPRVISVEPSPWNRSTPYPLPMVSVFRWFPGTNRQADSCAKRAPAQRSGSRLAVA